MALRVRRHRTIVVLFLLALTNNCLHACVGEFIATEKIEAENYSWAENCKLYTDCSDPNIIHVGNIGPSTVLEYDDVVFGSGVEAITLRVGNFLSGGDASVIYVHLGSSTSNPVATIPIGYTGSGYCDFIDLLAFFQVPPTGTQNLFFTFTDHADGFTNFDWFVFNQTVSARHRN